MHPRSISQACQARHCQLFASLASQNLMNSLRVILPSCEPKNMGFWLHWTNRVWSKLKVDHRWHPLAPLLVTGNNFLCSPIVTDFHLFWADMRDGEVIRFVGNCESWGSCCPPSLIGEAFQGSRAQQAQRKFQLCAHACNLKSCTDFQSKAFCLTSSLMHIPTHIPA